MGQDVTNQTRFCQIPQGSKKGLTWHLKSRRIFIAVGVSFILTTSLMYYLMLPSPLPSPPLPPPQLTTHGVITIDGDANFAATALVERWPGDGTPENPFIINGLYIDLGDVNGICINIINTRVSFIISNCNLTGAAYQMMGPPGAGICLDNVTGGELVNNNCNYNSYGIIVYDSDSNTVVNNTCNNNGIGIYLRSSKSNIRSGDNTVAYNTCNNNGHCGIRLSRSDENTVVNNTCNNVARYGIFLSESDFNFVMSNMCLNNTEHDIYLYDSYSNTLVNNIADIFAEFRPVEDDSEISEVPEVPEVYLLIVFVGYMEFIAITLLGVGLIAGNRVSKGE